MIREREKRRTLLSEPYIKNEWKQQQLRGNFLLAAQKTFEWYEEREEYILERARAGGKKTERESAFWAELDEYVIEMREASEKGLLVQEPDANWYMGSRGTLLWKLVGEHADVHIVAASLLREDGWSVREVAQLWNGRSERLSGEGWEGEYKRILKESREVLEQIGADFAEVVMAKLELNDQHYPKELWAWTMVYPFGKSSNTFTRNLRMGVGDQTTQMDTLVMGKLGETFLAELHKSPFGSNGYGPKAIVVSPEGEVIHAQTDMHESYGLYTMGYLELVS